MFSGRRVLAVVPARGGSKGILKKNLQLLNGVPLVVHAARVALELSAVDRAVVSTDDSEIASVAQSAGLAVNGLRPVELAGDRVADWPVLHHELLAAELVDRTMYELIVMLQPTCPLRRADHVTEALSTLVNGGFDSVWTVSISDPKFHPLKQLVVDREGHLEYFDPLGSAIIARQQLTPLYHRNGAAYVLTRSCLIEQGTIKGARAGAVIVDEPLVNIDTPLDLKLCEFLLSQPTAVPDQRRNQR
jgi:CMP-N-acetylneuraminic acid synthetase